MFCAGRSSKWSRVARVFVALLLGVWSTALSADANELSPGKQVVFLLRLMLYDRSLEERAGSEVTVLVLRRAGDRASEEGSTAIVRALEEVGASATVGGLPLQVATLAYSTPEALVAALHEVHPAAMYLCPGLDDAVPAISAATRGNGSLSVTGVESYVASGVSVALVARDDGPEIVVNLESSRQEGAQFGAEILRVAKIIQR